MIEIFEQKKLLTGKEVAQILGVKPSTISRWVYEKKIPFVKFGPGKKSIVMFNPKRLNQWINDNSHEPKSAGSCVYKLKRKPIGASKKTVERFEEFASKL